MQVRVAGIATLPDVAQVVTLFHPATHPNGARDGSILQVHQVGVVAAALDLDRDGVAGAVVVARAGAGVAAEVGRSGTNGPNVAAEGSVDRLTEDRVAARIDRATHVEVVGVDEAARMREVLVVALRDADTSTLLEGKEGQWSGVPRNRGRRPGVRGQEEADNGQGQDTPDVHCFALVGVWRGSFSLHCFG